MIHEKETIHFIVDWLINYIDNSKLNGFVVGVSGGIDSAVTSTLCAKTKKTTMVVEMSIHQNKTELKRGKQHIQWLQNNFNNVTTLDVELTNVFELLKHTFSNIKEYKNIKNNLVLSNTKSRLRMLYLYAVAGFTNSLVCGTGNKIEDFGIGFFTKYGDGGVDISPIANLMKSEVFQLGKELGIIQSIIDAPPTDGLWDDNRTDKEQIGATYEELEFAMKTYEKYGNTPPHFTSNRDKEVYEIYSELKNANQHKIKPIPVCILPKILYHNF